MNWVFTIANSAFLFGLCSQAWAFDHNHTKWDLLLKKHVVDSGVESRLRYRSIKEHPETLNAYLSELETVKPESFSSWGPLQRLAFLINAYNVGTVKLVIDHYPIKSIKKIQGDPWKKEFINLLGKRRHLDDLEHNLIRKEFNEPRVHFSLNHASKGSASLRGEAYVASRLEEQLENSMVRFLSDHMRNRYNSSKKLLELSRIFDWYREDFSKEYGSLENFLAPRITKNPDDQAEIRAGKARLRFLDYDWDLNEVL